MRRAEEELFQDADREEILTVLNFSKQPAVFVLPEKVKFQTAQLLLSNYPTRLETPTRLELKPFEAKVYALK